MIAVRGGSRGIGAGLPMLTDSPKSYGLDTGTPTKIF